MNGITEGDIVSLTSDSRRWRVLAIFTDRALIEIVGEAWVRQRTERLEELHLVNRPTDPQGLRTTFPGLTHHNGGSGLDGVFCFLVKPKLLD